MFNIDNRILIVVPFIGGGTERNVHDMIESWKESNLIILMRYVGRAVSLEIYSGHQYKKYDFFQNERDRYIFLNTIVNKYKIELVHVHHFWYMSSELEKFYLRLDIPLVITLHDYYAICPFTNMVMPMEMQFCGIPNTNMCNKCVERNKSFLNGNIVNITNYRDRMGAILSKASLIIVPSDDTQKRIECYFKNINIVRKYNPEIINISNKLIEKSNNRTSGNKKIGLLGTLSVIKGALVLKRVASLALKKNKAVEFVLFGKLAGLLNIFVNMPPNVKIKGTYDEKTIYNDILNEKIDFFWFPPICPETYSYTLSIPARLGIPSIGVKLGALTERIEGNGWGETYPLESSTDMILKYLLDFNYTKYTSRKSFSIEVDNFADPIKFYDNLLSANNTQNFSMASCNFEIEELKNKLPSKLSWQEASFAKRLGYSRISIALHMDGVGLFSKMWRRVRIYVNNSIVKNEYN